MKKGIICIGDDSISKTDDVIKINKNIICIANIDNILKCIYIIPDAFVNKKDKFVKFNFYID